MEKLIELLNEHFKEKYKNSKRNLIYFERYDDVNHWFNMNNEDRVYNWFVAEETILGKRYGFIKWLVENDKVNTRNLNLQVFKSMFSNDGTVEISYEELILMLLAISDEPIEFLIDLLK